MNFIIGLGNPGSEYQHTRHNLGFMILDQLANKWQVTFTSQKKCQSEIAKNATTMLVKPQTFMNNSGEAVQAILKYYGNAEQSPAEFPNLFVVFDDLDLEVGTFKIQYGTGPKIHNGTGSIYAHLKTHLFWHVRIGADNRKGDRTIPATQYVLGKFSKDEEPLLTSVFDKVCTELENRVK